MIPTDDSASASAPPSMSINNSNGAPDKPSPSSTIITASISAATTSVPTTNANNHDEPSNTNLSTAKIGYKSLQYTTVGLGTFPHQHLRHTPTSPITTKRNHVHAGSAYAYTYIASGEFMAFLIGWSVILEYVLSVASVARGWSGTIDAMSQSKISNGTISVFGRFPGNNEFLGQYPDFLGAGTVIVLGLVLSCGAKLSARVNSVVTILNLSVILIATILMFSLPNPETNGIAPSSHGGFLPYGFGGMIAGAGTCFYAFIGFDAITVSGEEAVDPQRSLPIATGVSVSMITIIFVLATASLSLFVPWWTVDRQAAFTAAMRARNVQWATYVTGIGSLLGIGASLFTSLYAMPRIVYAMAADGLLPDWLGYVLPSTRVPVVAMALFGGMAAVLTFLCDIHTLAEFLSIGTLIAYTIVCMNVCILRYHHTETVSASEASDLAIQKEKKIDAPAGKIIEADSAEFGDWAQPTGSLKSAFRDIPVLRDWTPGRAPIIALVCYVFCALGLAAFALVGTEKLIQLRWWAIFLAILFLLIAIVCLLIMLMHNQDKSFDTFKVPFVPVLPCLCIFLNMCLIVKLSPLTWVRFFVWLIVGLLIYFGYGWWHSREADGSGESDLLLTYKTVNNESTETEQPAPIPPAP
ncbi:hypothetical protein SprV_0100147400 [Sparganum proliferum]